MTAVARQAGSDAGDALRALEPADPAGLDDR